MTTRKAAYAAVVFLFALWLPSAGCEDDEVIADITCGNQLCEPGENLENCAVDCGPPCGDDLCEIGESFTGCPEDCAPGPLYPGPCRADTISQGIGSGTGSYQFEYERVEVGMRVTFHADDDDDDEIDRSWRNTYDDHGNVVEVELYDHPGGSINWREVLHFDAENRCTGEDFYWDDPDVLSARKTHEYDADGYLQRSVTESMPSGTVSYEIVYEWNLDHTHCIENHDNGGNGTVDATHLYFYDELGNVTGFEWDSEESWDCDHFYDYDNPAYGPAARYFFPDLELRVTPTRLLREECLDNGSRYAEEFIYEDHGNLLRKEYYRPDQQTEPINITTFYYDCWQ